jgi:hypothetical protein
MRLMADWRRRALPIALFSGGREGAAVAFHALGEAPRGSYARSEADARSRGEARGARFWADSATFAWLLKKLFAKL